MEIEDFLNIAVILVALALIGTVLLQARGAGVGEMFGGGMGGSGYRTRRGVERVLFQLTIVLMVVFVILAALNVRAHN
ncbi:MAG TPA: preprotein translocase subunit SecG [Dehalococcoidia bacterium]|nr:preprotein translocase subunit SecG [Dehalococcoidia bacterium]